MNKRLLLSVLCLAFAIRIPAQTAQPVPVALTWNYDAQKKTLTLHLANNSGKDITAYNISMAERYADGSTNYVDGRPNDIHDHQIMEELLNTLTKEQHTFAAGTIRDYVIPEAKAISDVEAVVDMVIYADRTLDVQNERAFRQLLASRKGQLLAMQKVNEVVKQVLADPRIDSPVAAILADLIPFADAMDRKNRSPEDPESNEAMGLRGDIQNLQMMQRSLPSTAARERLTQYVGELEKRIALLLPHCNLGVIIYQ
jgi:hypothetical protein